MRSERKEEVQGQVLRTAAADKEIRLHAQAEGAARLPESVLYDVLGIGIGPFNLGLAALLQKTPRIQSLFVDQKTRFDWHAGMLIEGTTLQVPFFADLVTMADPTNPLSFLNYLHEQGRHYAFYFLEKFHIPRREYNEYCRWAAGKLPSCQFGMEARDVRLDSSGSESVFEVDVYDTASGETRTYRTRNLALGVGSVPSVGERFRTHLGESVFHSADFMNKLEQCRRAKSVTVIGSGQSAGEIFLRLLQEQEACGYRLDWFTRSAGFFPMEYSKLGLEHFSPDYTNYFYQLPQAVKDEIREGQALLYKGISAATIADIYDALYEASVGGKELAVRLLASTEVRNIKPVSGEKSEQVRLTCRHLIQDEHFTHDSDVVIFATGYTHTIPRCLGSLQDLIRWDSAGRYEVGGDYKLALKEELANSIYIQNGELHTHGVGAPDLGLGAHRNSVIINSLAGETVYPVRERNVFQQFGIR
ncbi:lysine N(6)-hydroxylase/L-ornithine N(5)-oxygenase family protein [Paenibacillus lutrae]|uniref:L-lysine N6-monooxygenase MbtG n=1 Tax=Paenibacillus lutrae TaxID=2078573 RepID=A0A7X3FLN6_9BACL|nr:lysine N(6)-hydroxylase/L-ornithine N(5)-oxygenase family protein [Paenibacillus lutrae]MVP01935.1 SidA/IucD/PvdA family monooxygenase [Paenibacillus lutrae]